MAESMLDALLGAPIKNWKNPDYGLRVDGTAKKEGFLGKIPAKNNRVMTELSIGVEIDGKEMLIPAIVPTLNEEEISFLSAGGDPGAKESIIKKSVDHAVDRMQRGRKPFYGDR